MKFRYRTPMKLMYSVPMSWLEASDQERLENSNGCGAGWKSEKNVIKRFFKNVLNRVVPETIYGMYIGDLCNWHDFDFTFLEKTYANFDMANTRFLHNLNVRIELKGGRLKWLRLRRAKKCYWFVDKCGWKAFLDD